MLCSGAVLTNTCRSKQKFSGVTVKDDRMPDSMGIMLTQLAMSRGYCEAMRPYNI